MLYLSYHIHQIVIQHLFFTSQPVSVVIDDTSVPFDTDHRHGTVFHKLLVKAVIHTDTDGNHDNNG
jgi:hypothetical protein